MVGMWHVRRMARRWCGMGVEAVNVLADQVRLDTYARPGSKLRRVLDLLADGQRHYSHELHDAYRGEGQHGWEFRGAVDQLRKKGLAIPDATWDAEKQDHWYQLGAAESIPVTADPSCLGAHPGASDLSVPPPPLPDRPSRKSARVPTSSAMVNRNDQAALPLFGGTE